MRLNPRLTLYFQGETMKLFFGSSLTLAGFLFVALVGNAQEPAELAFVAEMDAINIRP
jgi:hypothetical protein